MVPLDPKDPKTHYGYGADQRPKHFVIRAAISYIKELLRLVGRLDGLSISYACAVKSLLRMCDFTN